MSTITLGIAPSPVQMAAQFINSTQRHIFLTGRAGTGKTTFLRSVIKQTYKNAIIVAPTGIAAINAGGVTIHSQFQIPPCTFLPTHDKSDLGTGNFHNALSLLRHQRLSKDKQRVIRDLELLVIDEVSMLRADLLDAIDTTMRSVRRTHNRPFGGVQVLFIGDLLQLPPVVKDEEWNTMKKFYASPFFFHAKVLEDAPPVYIELEKIHRQSDEKFIGLLNNLRNNTVTKADEELLNQHFKPGYFSVPQDKYIQLTTHNHKAETMNKDALRKLDTKTVFCEADIEDDFPVSMFPADVKLELKAGAQVMFLRNDSEGKYFNGKIGIVEAIEEKFLLVKCENETLPIKVAKYTWENIKYGVDPMTGRIESDVVGTFTQYPVRLAWAITVHKSQGLTFTKAIIDLEQAFAPGQVYVALSRLKSLDGLILSTRVNLRSLRQDATVNNFSLAQADAQSLVPLLAAESKSYIRNYVMNCFNLKPIQDAFMRFIDEVPATEERSTRARYQAWARNLVNGFQSTEIMATRFMAQLYGLGDDWSNMQTRVIAAKNYFLPVIQDTEKIIDLHIAEVTQAKGVKQYLTDLKELKLLVIRQLRQLGKAEKILAGVITNTTVTKDELYAAEYFPGYRRKKAVTQYDNDESSPAQNRKTKQKKGDSVNATYELHKRGMNREDIAKQRGMTVGTITSHLTELIADGRCTVEEFIAADKLANIRLAAEALGTRQLIPLKEHLGDSYSFDDLRMAFIREYHVEKQSEVLRIVKS